MLIEQLRQATSTAEKLGDRTRELEGQLEEQKVSLAKYKTKMKT